VSTEAINSNLLARLKDKKYRDLFIASQINRIIPYQIRALRAARNNMTQEELAERAETTQSAISRIKSRGAASMNIKTLLKLASAFDVALVVRFEPIDRFVDWVDDLSPEVMSPKPSEVVLTETEKGAGEQQAVHRDTARLAYSGYLRPASRSEQTGPTQARFSFDAPYLAWSSDRPALTAEHHEVKVEDGQPPVGLLRVG
jgi:transcriptional regulator with XRE-family HTH domain